MPSFTRYSLFAALFSLFSTAAICQSEDSLKTENDELPRPEIELGLGTLSLYSDIGSLGGISQSNQLNWGYHLALRNHISHSFGLNIFALFGSVKANERLIANDANVKSQIRMGGISLTYNFNALLPKERLITPYISAGITTFEFNPKGDYRDANGNFYNYWNDGSIRNISQNSPNAEDAIILQRDYNYETDLRATRERQDQYDLRAFSIPVGAGVNLDVSPSFQIRMGIEYHFSTTDFIDNISSDEVSGNSRNGNDNFLYSHVGLAYNLKHKKTTKGPALNYEIEMQENLEYADQDMDGIADIVDKCPNTPTDAEIDIYGCPVDKDKDGIPDYRDLELTTEEGALVNLDGVTASDEEIERMYQLYKDSVGDLSIDKSQTYTADVANRIRLRSKKKGYRLEFTNTGDLSPEEIGELLSIPDVRSEEEKGRTIYYMGEYESVSEALGRKLSLDETDFNSKLVYVEFGKKTDISDQEVRAISEFANPIAFNSDQVIYRVQIGAYRYKLSSNVFKDVPDLLVIEGNDGLTRYVSGSFPSLKRAAEHKIDLLLKGYEGAFVTAYRGGTRISLKDAGAAVKGEEKMKERSDTEIIDKDLVHFTVELASFEGRIPAKTLSDLMSIGNVRPIRGSNGITRYVLGSFDTLNEANKELEKYKELGYSSAAVKGEFNGKIISAEEAQKLKSE